MRARFTLFEGPSLLAPFAAVMAQVDVPRAAIAVDRADGILRQLLSPALLSHLPLADGRFETMAAALANGFQDCFGANELPVQAGRSPGGDARILLGYLDPVAATLALQTALEITAGVFAQLAGQPVDAAALTAKMQRTVEQMRVRQPDPLARVLIRAARRRAIPVCPVAPGSRVWLFGQGARGVHFFEVANHFDALTGSRLARNKFQANQLVTRLGFPGVRHGLVSRVEDATRLAREIGYPVVVKPVASGKGAGVTAFITDEAGVLAAFAEARRADPGEVLVERYVVGEDHRLAIIGGRFSWAVRRSLPVVVADGEHSILALMEMANRQRAASPEANIGAGKLVLDAEVRAVLASQGLSADDRPAAGTRVILRRIANVARGGTATDCTASVHPEVRDMAEAIARSLHLDAMGLDFMTPDISRSWREVECAVLEVNATPGFTLEERAELVVDAKFPGGCDGRIPAIVLVGAGAATLEQVAAACTAAGRRVGCTDSTATFMDGWPRMTSRDATLPARVTALVMDAACDALVIAATPAEIERHGFPLAGCRLALLGDAPLSEPLRTLVESCAGVVHRLTDGGDPGVLVQAAIPAA